MGYRHDRNEEEQIPFELERSIPITPRTFFKDYTDTLVRQLLEQHPAATLRELCEHVRREHNLTVSISSMHRALQRLGLCHRGKKQATEVTHRPAF